MTLCEAILWNELKQRNLGVDFDRQRPIDNYIVDFYCKDLMLAIEVDGATHYTEAGVEKDLIRQEKLEKLGIRFLRFDDDDIKTNINGVLEIIRNWIGNNRELQGRVNPASAQAKESNPPTNHSGSNPPPDPSREGSKRRKKDKQFHFKQFSVRHDRSGMKVGTDGVLLGAWANVAGAKTILDIGTGTGVIALMLAQRTDHAKIHAIEIHEDAFQDALENFNVSKWKDRLILHSGAIQQFTSDEKFDLLISNPPYFLNSYKPPSLKRETARHTETLSFDELLTASEILLTARGKLNVILPYTEGQLFISLALQKGFSCTRKWSFKSRAHKPVERLLLEFSSVPLPCQEGEILLYDSGEEWSSAYRKLTGDFYLKI